MSRRDTIIVAVLVNAALLMILFATAMSSKDKEVQSSLELVQAPALETVDEKNLLDQYVTSVPTLAEKPEKALSFTEELELTFTPPEPIAAPKANLAGKYVDVTVKKGDFLEKIASANQTSVATIMQLNGLESSNLKIGQVLKVPLSKGRVEQKTVAPVEQFYVVKDGDNPWLIASRNNIRLDELLRLNNLDEQKARRLRPGDRLRIK